MRKVLKNRFYTKISSIFSSYPTRIFRQKKSKWIRIKKNISNSKKLFSYVNAYIIKKSLKNWDKFRSLYKLQLNSKRFISKLYQDSFNLNKKTSLSIFSKEKRILSLYARPVYRLDIVLWLLLFTCSPFYSRELINRGLIYLNGIKLMNNITLYKGDIIEIKFDLKKSYLENKLRYSVSQKILSFLEIDYYTQSFCCLKDLSGLDKEDIYLLSTDYVDTQKF